MGGLHDGILRIGCGRVAARLALAASELPEDHGKAVAGVECRRDVDVIDEIPGAYKPIDQVMAAQGDLVEVVHELKQGAQREGPTRALNLGCRVA